MKGARMNGKRIFYIPKKDRFKEVVETAENIYKNTNAGIKESVIKAIGDNNE